MVNLKEKLLYCAQFFELTKADLARKIGVSKSNFVGESLKSELNGASLIRFCEQFPDVSAEWLLRDQGPMLKSDIKDAMEHNVNNGVNVGHIGSEHHSEQNPEQSQNCDACKLLQAKQEVIEAQKIAIEALMKRQ